jgi:hypothetical protein
MRKPALREIRPQRFRRRSLFGAMVAVTALLATAGTAIAVITPTPRNAAGATAIANSIVADSDTVTGASYDAVPPSGSPNGTSNSSLTGFPTNGSTFGILTTGSVALADDPNNSGSSGLNNGGGNVRGNSDQDVTILKINVVVPAGNNCLGVDFRFLSEEFPEFVGAGVSDSFVAELDTSNWTTTGGGNPPTAPNNFAFDENGDPISINSTGSTGMSASQASGTTYDGATGLLSANEQVTPGAHTLYLSIFDQGDGVYDSAVFLDNLRFFNVANPEVDCAPGAEPAGCRTKGLGNFAGTFPASDIVIRKGDSLSSDTSKTVGPPNSAIPQKLHLAWGPPSDPTQHKFGLTSKLTLAECLDTTGVNPGQGQILDTLIAEGGGTVDGSPGYKIRIRLVDGGENGSGSGAGRDRVHVRITKVSDGSRVLLARDTLSSGNQDTRDGP